MNKTTILLIMMIVLISLVVEAQISNIQDLKDGDKITISPYTGKRVK